MLMLTLAYLAQVNPFVVAGVGAVVVLVLLVLEALENTLDRRSRK